MLFRSGGFRGGNGGIFASCEAGERALENAAAPGGADCGGASWEPRRFRNGFVGLGGREGGVGLAGADAIDVGPLGVNGLLSVDGSRDRFPSGEGERDFSSSGCAATRTRQLNMILRNSGYAKKVRTSIATLQALS